MPVNLKQINSSLTAKVVDKEFLGSDLKYGTTHIPCGSDANVDGYHIVVLYQMYNNENFVKVYRDGVELVYNVDWVWGRPIAGATNDISHSIRINIAQYAAGSTYRVVYTEYVSNMQPSAYLYRTDAFTMRNRAITSRIYYNAGGVNPCNQQSLIAWELAEAGDYVYDVTYGKASPIVPPYDCATAVRKGFGTHLSVREFPENASMGDWRLETWTSGNKRGHPINTGNINLNPHLVSTNNRIRLKTLSMDDLYLGVWYILLRNTRLNIVTNFAPRKLSIRRKVLWQEGYFGDTMISAYVQTGLV